MLTCHFITLITTRYHDYLTKNNTTNLIVGLNFARKSAKLSYFVK